MITAMRALALASAGLLALMAPAFAHAHLNAAMPPANGTVAQAPSELDLTFSEGIDLKFTGVTVTGPGRAAVAPGAARRGAGGNVTLVVPLAAPLAAGTYRVDWHALATDGHKTTGSYSFSVKP